MEEKNTKQQLGSFVPSQGDKCMYSPAAGTFDKCADCPYREECLKRRQINPQAQQQEQDKSILQIRENLKNVKHKIVVLSGKGGVGKSTFSAQFALTLALAHKIHLDTPSSAQSQPDDEDDKKMHIIKSSENILTDEEFRTDSDQDTDMDIDFSSSSSGKTKIYQVGILDVDLCGPSIPKMMHLEDQKLHSSNLGWTPAYFQDNLGVVSIGFMLPNQDDAVIWRGPKKNGLIKQFLRDVYWGESLDYLIVDTPPGTSDEHITVVQYLRDVGIDGAVIITTPQDISCIDVRREINFCLKCNIPIIGVIENMSGFVCPHCKTATEIFHPTSGGGEALAAMFNVPFLGRIPLDQSLMMSCENGKSIIQDFPNSPAAKAIKVIVEKLEAGLLSQQTETNQQQSPNNSMQQ